jgi:DNA-binding MarR family transcriptional regulator
MVATTGADARAMNALRRLVSALRTSGATASREKGMSVAQLFALRVIARQPRLSMGELADQTLTTPSAVSEVVSRLVVRGLVRREPDPLDQRRVLVSITPQGELLRDDMEETIPERLVAALGSMSPSARRGMATALEQWVRLAGLDDVAPAMFGEGARGGGRKFADRVPAIPEELFQVES